MSLVTEEFLIKVSLYKMAFALKELITLFERQSTHVE